MSLSTQEIYDIDHSMTALQNISFGEMLSGMPTAAGVHTVTSGEASASAVAIDTGIVDTIVGHIVQIYRSNVQVTSDAVVTITGDVLGVADGSTYNVTAGDVINYIVW